MNYREIPETAVEVQPGLWADFRTVTLGSMTITKSDLYSAEGYCFYEIEQPENYVDGDTSGELLPPEQRVYATFMYSAYSTVEEINAAIVSVPYVPGYEVVSIGTGTNHETI